jgi:hypothetical protein
MGFGFKRDHLSFSKGTTAIGKGQPSILTGNARSMNLRHQWFAAWLCFTALWWSLIIFDGDGALILLKFRLGGWRAAFVYSVLTVLIGVTVPGTVLLLGWIGIWAARKFKSGQR